MRTFVLAAILTVAGASGAQAQTSCQNYGSQRICTGNAPTGQGTASQRLGSQMATVENGVTNMAELYGARRTTTFADGSTASSQRYGNQTVTTFSNGGTATSQRFGNATVTTFSDGRTVTCQAVYGQQICN